MAKAKLPVGARLMGDSVYEVRYRHAGDGKNYRHEFERANDTQMYCLPDGSVLLRSRSGVRLWDTFTVGDDE